MPIFEKPVDPAEIDADGLAYEVVARLQKHGGVSVVTVGTKVTPPPWDDPHLDHLRHSHILLVNRLDP
jgi:hypothetical protein